MIEAAFEWTALHRPEYLKAIEKRPSGSQWGKGDRAFIPWQKLAVLPWQMLPRDEHCQPIHLEQCFYFWVDGEHIPSAFTNFRLLSEFNDLSKVEVVTGSHGLELKSHEVSQRPANIAWLILGVAKDSNGVIHEGKLIVWSAFPGELTVSLKHIPQFDGTIESLMGLDLPIAVKGVA